MRPEIKLDKSQPKREGQTGPEIKALPNAENPPASDAKVIQLDIVNRYCHSIITKISSLKNLLEQKKISCPDKLTEIQEVQNSLNNYLTLISKFANLDIGSLPSFITYQHACLAYDQLVPKCKVFFNYDKDSVYADFINEVSDLNSCCKNMLAFKKLYDVEDARGDLISPILFIGSLMNHLGCEFFFKAPESRLQVLNAKRYDEHFITLLAANKKLAEVFLKASVEDKPHLIRELKKNRLGQHFLMDPIHLAALRDQQRRMARAFQFLEMFQFIGAALNHRHEPRRRLQNVDIKLTPQDADMTQILSKDQKGLVVEKDLSWAEKYNCGINYSKIQGPVGKVLKRNGEYQYYKLDTIYKEIDISGKDPLTRDPLTRGSVEIATEEYRLAFLNDYVKYELRPQGLKFDEIQTALIAIIEEMNASVRQGSQAAENIWPGDLIKKLDFYKNQASPSSPQPRANASEQKDGASITPPSNANAATSPLVSKAATFSANSFEAKLAASVAIDGKAEIPSSLAYQPNEDFLQRYFKPLCALKKILQDFDSIVNNAAVQKQMGAPFMDSLKKSFSEEVREQIGELKLPDENTKLSLHNETEIIIIFTKIVDNIMPFYPPYYEIFPKLEDILKVFRENNLPASSAPTLGPR